MKPDLLDRFISFAQSYRLFHPTDQIIVALSGGADSVALVDLFARLNQPIILAHCNFNLRGIESDHDEEFVRKISVVYDIPLHVIEFQTREHASAKGISIEMAARELRYEWFEDVRISTGSISVAVAHHSDDSIETMLINLIRGTGIKGLSGIQPRMKNLIRPLLFSSKQEITKYLEWRQLEYRFDSSNKDSSYIRNRIRNIILPEFEKVNPSVRQVLLEEQVLFKQAHGIIKEYTDLKRAQLVLAENDQTKINIPVLMGEEFPETILFEILRPFHFNGRQIRQILHAAASHSGKIFKSSTHTLLIDREKIFIIEGFETETDRYYFDPDLPEVDLPIKLTSRIIHEKDKPPSRDPLVASLDYDKLDLPLILRRWEQGDYFYPLGMAHSKKVSDFFIDQKINRINKSRTWILASGEKIVWIIGQRIDNRFRVTEETKTILEIDIRS
jgi:tRNA(Ile)-lysidine synthase